MKKNAEKFRGVGVALVTPFKSDSSLDEAAFERLIDFQIEEGTNFLVPCGTTGENPALTHGEHRRVVEIAARRSMAGAMPQRTGFALQGQRRMERRAPRRLMREREQLNHGARRHTVEHR